MVSLLLGLFCLSVFYLGLSLKPKEEELRAEFEVSSLTLSSTEVGVQEPVTVSITVKNIGNIRETLRVVLTIDGCEATHEMFRGKIRGEVYEHTELNPGETKTITFNVTLPEGTRTIGVNALFRDWTTDKLVTVENTAGLIQTLKFLRLDLEVKSSRSL